MADTKISELPAASALAGTEPLPTVQDGDTKRTTAAAIAALVDQSGKADKTTTITAGDGLEGGGSLAANRTIALSAGTLATLGQVAGKADATALSALDGRVEALEEGGGGGAPGIGIPRLILAGDSKAAQAAGMSSASWLHYALALAGVAFRFDPSLDNRGVSGATPDTSATPATDAYGQPCPLGFAHDTTIAALVARVEARVAEGDDVAVWFQIGTNDPATDTHTVAALRKVIAACRTAGAKMFLVNDVPPAYNGANSETAANFQSTNTRLAQLAEAEPDVRHLRLFEATVDPTSANSNPLGGASGGALAATRDGVHESEYGAYLEGKALAPQIRAIFPAAELRYGGPGDVYQAFFGAGAYPTTALATNLLKNPLFSGAGGTDSTTKAGTASVTGDVPANYVLSGALSGDVAVTLSRVDADDLNERFGRTDFTALRIAFSGTPAANSFLSLGVDQGIAALHPLVDGRHAIRSQILARTNALTGTTGVSLDLFGVGSGNNTNYASATQQLPPLDDLLFMQSTDYAETPSGGPPSWLGIPNAGATIYMRSGVALSGSIDLIWADARLVVDLPDAMA